MRSPKILILSGKIGTYVQALLLAAEQKHISAQHAGFDDIVIRHTGKAFECLFQGTPLEKIFDILILRGNYGPYKNEICIITHYFLGKNKLVLDPSIGSHYISGKMYESSLLSKAHLPHLKTIQILSESNKRSVLSYLKLPLIVKPINGSQGRGISLIKTKEELASFPILQGTDKFIFQEYVPLKSDIRVFVVGNTAIGSMRRNVIPGDVRSNASLGGKTEKIELTSEMQDLAIRATCAYGYDIAGVDLIKKDGKFIILEVNNAPQWASFQKVTGINPAPLIIEHALKKYYRKNFKISQICKKIFSFTRKMRRS